MYTDLPQTTVAIWRVTSAGQFVGDFPEPQLLSWVVSGQVRPDDQVWRPGMDTFMPVAAMHPFAPYFTRQWPDRGSAADDEAIRWLLPVGRSPWAIAAGYLGLCSILLVFGPFAIVAGILGIRQIKHNPQLHGMGRCIFGIVAGTIAVFVGAAMLA